jgi:ankyrin repeat protein
MKGPTLYRISAERRYERIPDHVKEHPEDVYWTDHHGSTELHILCQARDVSPTLLVAVESIVKEAPALIAQCNIATWTPLHYASEKRTVWGGGENHGATELVLMLLKYCPRAVSLKTQTGLKSGKTPFHIACEANADIRVLRAMLQINPGLSTVPYVKKDVYSVAENPLQLLWNNNDNNSRSSSRRQLSNNSTATSEKMALLLRAAHYGTVEDDFHQGSRIRLVNAACSVRCPLDYFAELIQHHPYQVRELDERNLYPLHYAVQNASVDAQAYTKEILEILLDIYPGAAAQVDEDGRLPLHVALMDSKLTWHKGGVKELVYAYPNALGIRDPLYNLHPFMASAYHSTKSMLHLSTTYELLLAAPDAIEANA